MGQLPRPFIVGKGRRNRSRGALRTQPSVSPFLTRTLPTSTLHSGCFDIFPHVCKTQGQRGDGTGGAGPAAESTVAFVYRGDLRRGRKPPPVPEAQALPLPGARSPWPLPLSSGPVAPPPGFSPPQACRPAALRPSSAAARRPTALQPSPGPADPPSPRFPSGRCRQPGLQGPERGPRRPHPGARPASPR